MTPRSRIIPVFIPHLGCEHACVFCNQRRISGQLRAATRDTVLGAIRRGERFIPDEVPAELAFYGGSFSAIPVSEQETLLDAARVFINGGAGRTIRVSTRPDCIDDTVLARFRDFGVGTVELGAQSMCDDVLSRCGRGHTAEDTARAAGMVRAAGMRLILQMMTGLPGDTPERSVYTARQIIALHPDGARIYPTVVIRDTELYELWRRGAYRAHSVGEAVSVCAAIVPLFQRAGIPVIRLGLNPTQELSGGDAAAGAYHPAFGELVYSRIYLVRARALLSGVPAHSSVTLGVAGGEVSKLAGQRRENLETLKREFALRDISISAHKNVKSGDIVILRIENGR